MNNSAQDLILRSLLFSPISQVAGVGEKRSKLYKKLGVSTVRDLILLMPYRVVHRKINPGIAEIKSGDQISKVVRVQSIYLPSYSRKGSPSKVICESNGEEVELVYFNMPRKLLTEQYKEGLELIVSGEAVINYGVLSIIHPEQVVKLNESYKIAEFEPIYSATRGLNSRFIGITIKRVLAKIPNVEEWLPKDLVLKHKWPNFRQALEVIHNPKGLRDVESTPIAKQRIAFDEIFAHQLQLRALKDMVKSVTRPPLSFTGTLKNKMLSILPFTLTSSQLQVIGEIEEELHKSLRISRLIQGDVGSGKTLIALSLMLNCVEAGFQAAIMVPTEILALQHAKNITEIASKIGVECQLLISNMTAVQKREAYSNIESGHANIVIGTHALFQERAIYHSLRLVIIDEQHRFGVEQRKKLLCKGIHADFIMMTATPIPRTLEMVSYGDMDVSIIKQKPSNRKEIITSIISYKKASELEDSLNLRILSGEKIYWVCPLITETEKLDLAQVEARFKSLSAKFEGMVGLVHGKMKQGDRDLVMQKFVDGEYKIVVATTVIEVGVDVRDATVMIIENAERFGLSQLHQLRGRVGRGDKQSYCILMYGKNFGPVSQKRLNIMRNSSDGFLIAEEDLKLRGAGDIVGTKQSGLPSFRVFDIEMNQDLLKLAFEISNSNTSSTGMHLEIFAKDVSDC
jgi:ATP-dependent DNA helicase RecG